jgi:hypothetical protein
MREGSCEIKLGLDILALFLVVVAADGPRSVVSRGVGRGGSGGSIQGGVGFENVGDEMRVVALFD